MITLSDTRTMDTFIVRIMPDNIIEIKVDTSIFDDCKHDRSDPYIEAASQAFEVLRSRNWGLIRPVVECWKKENPKNEIALNSYWILINISAHVKAECLRQKSLLKNKFDLAKEPIKATLPSKK